MAFTQTDLDNLKSALLALATGQRIVTVTKGDRTVTYAQADIDKLRTLVASVENDIASSSTGRRRFVLTTTDKGL